MNKSLVPGPAGPARLVLTRLRHGRPLVLAGRLLGGFALAQITLHAGAGPAPAAGVLAGIITWLAIASHGDIAPPRGR